MDFIPLEIELLILEFCDPVSLCLYESTCKQLWKNPHQKIWQKIIYNNLLIGIQHKKPECDVNWKRTYVELSFHLKFVWFYTNVPISKAVSNIIIENIKLPPTFEKWIMRIYNHDIACGKIPNIQLIDDLWKNAIKQGVIHVRSIYENIEAEMLLEIMKKNNILMTYARAYHEKKMQQASDHIKNIKIIITNLLVL